MKPWGIQHKNRLETLASSHLFSETRPALVKTTQFYLNWAHIWLYLACGLRFYPPHLTLHFSPRQIVVGSYILLSREDIILL
jgi:hypothetical protein